MNNQPLYTKVTFPLTQQLAEPLDLSMHLPFRLAVVTNLLQLNKDAFIKNITQLEPREFRVLINIGSYMPIKSADIAYLGRLDSYTVSRAVKSLLKSSLVRVEPSDKNLKIKNLVLTQNGINLYHQICDSIQQRTDELESVLSDKEKSEIIRLLELLESKSESMIAGHALSELALQKNIAADQKEIIRWYRKSAKGGRLFTSDNSNSSGCK